MPHDMTTAAEHGAAEYRAARKRVRQSPRSLVLLALGATLPSLVIVSIGAAKEFPGLLWTSINLASVFGTHWLLVRRELDRGARSGPTDGDAA